MTGRASFDAAQLAVMPRGIFAKLRESAAPVWNEETGAWYVVHREQVERALRDERLVVRDPNRASDGHRSHVDAFLDLWPMRTDVGKQRDIKQALLVHFSARHAESLRLPLHEASEDIVDAVSFRSFDYVSEVAIPAAASTSARVLELGNEEMDELRPLAQSVLNYVLTADRTSDVLRAAETAIDAIRGFVRSKYLSRDAFVSRVLAGSDDEEAATAMFTQLLTGSIDPLADASTSALLYYHPSNRPIDGVAIDPPFYYAPRFASEDLPDLAPGILAGDRVLLVLASADVEGETRSPARSSGAPSILFGRGRHFCLGAALANVHIEENLRTAKSRGLVDRVDATSHRRLERDGGAGHQELIVNAPGILT